MTSYDDPYLCLLRDESERHLLLPKTAEDATHLNVERTARSILFAAEDRRCVRGTGFTIDEVVISGLLAIIENERKTVKYWRAMSAGRKFMHAWSNVLTKLRNE